MKDNWYVINDFSYNRELHKRILKRLSENHRIVFRREFLFYDEIPEADRWEFSKEWLDSEKEKFYPDKNLCYKNLPDISFGNLISKIHNVPDEGLRYDWYIAEDEKRFNDLVQHSFTYNVMITDDISDYENSLLYMEYIEHEVFTLAINDLKNNIDKIRVQLAEVTYTAVNLQKFDKTLK